VILRRGLPYVRGAGVVTGRQPFLMLAWPMSNFATVTWAILRRLQAVELEADAWSVAICYLDCSDLREFQKTRKLYSWPDDKTICDRTGLAPEDIAPARRRLVALGLMKREKQLMSGADGVIMYQLDWAFRVPPSLLRPAFRSGRTHARIADEGQRV